MKRFLALFAVMAMIVSMFSGVVFAAPETADAYTIANAVIAKGSGTDVKVGITRTAGTSGNLRDFTVDVAGASGLTELVIDSSDEITLDGSKLDDLASGTYVIKLTEGTQTVGSTDYTVPAPTGDPATQTVAWDPSNTTVVTLGTLTVVDANVDNITAGKEYSAITGSVDAHDDVVGTMLGLMIKDSKGEYVTLNHVGVLKNTAGTPVNLTSEVVVDVDHEDGKILRNVQIDTVAMLDAEFTDSDTNISTIDVWEYFSKHNSTGTLELRLTVSSATIDEHDTLDDTIYIDFTYSAVPLEIELTEDMYYFDEDGSIISINGKIMNKHTEATFDYDTDNLTVYTDNGNLRVFDLSHDVTGTGHVADVSNGRFDINFVSSNGDNGIEFFWVYSEEKTPSRGDYFFTNDGADNFVLTPEFELDTDLDFDFPFDDNLRITGVFVNEDNDFGSGTPSGIKKEDIVIAYLHEDNEYLKAPVPSGGLDPVEAAMVSKSSFGFLDSGDYFTKSGDIGLFFNDVRVMKGEITPGELTVDFGPDRLQNKLDSQEMTLSFDLGSDYFDDDKDVLESNYQLILKIEDEDEKKVDIDDAKTQYDDKSTQVKNTGTLADYVVIVDSSTSEFTKPSDQEVVVELPVDDWERGTYTAYVKLYDTTSSAPTVVQETSFEFEIKKPSAHNLVGWSLDEIGVGKTTFSFDEGANVDQTIIVKDEDGIEIEYLEVVFNGSGLDDEDFANSKYDDEADDDFEINVKETGTITVKIHVYEDENDDTPDKTFTEEIKVTGWNVEINPEEILVNSEEDVVFVITDEDGDPVNNAVIVIDGKTLVDSAKDNVIGGVYTYEVDEDVFEFDAVGELDVEFHKGSVDGTKNLEVTLEGGIEVLGEEIYSVEAVEITSMVNGLEETLLISVLDDNGDIVFPTYYRIDVDSDGDESSPEEIPSGDLGSFKDVDGVAGKEAREITLLPDGSQQAIIIRATTDDGEKMGEVRIEVQKPQLVMEMGQILTENFKNELEFTVIDPRDNSILEQDLYLEAKTDYVSYTVEDAEGNDVIVTDGKSEMITFDDDMYKFEIFVNDIDWDEAEDDEEDVEISLYIELEKDVKITDLAIEKPSFTSDPETIVMDTGTVLTLTYLDANGKPLVDYEIELDGDEVGVTDENGQVVYSASSASSVSLTFKAETDDTKDDDGINDEDPIVTELKVRSSADTLPPVATYEVNGTTAIITITDNVRILKAFVDGVEVDMFFPMPTATHVVTGLKIGDNNIQVLASDTKNNILDTMLVITIEPLAEPVEFTIGEETTYGTPVLMSDITMVPVRFAQDLGATVEWDNDTQTVTYTLGEIKVAMTIGSTTAIVNDSNVQLAVAPYKNELGRTMVPLRMIAQELGFTVEWTSNDAPIMIK